MCNWIIERNERYGMMENQNKKSHKLYFINEINDLKAFPRWRNQMATSPSVL